MMRGQASFGLGSWIAVALLLAPACNLSRPSRPAAGPAGQAGTPVAKPVGETRLVLDFEDASIFTSENNSPFEVSARHVTQGARSSRVHYTNQPEWSNILTEALRARDWSGFRYLNLDLFLEGDNPAVFGIWVRDMALHKADINLPIGPGYNSITIDLDELRRSANLDLGSIKAICLYKGSSDEFTVYLDNLYLSHERPVAPAIRPVRMGSENLVRNGGFEEVGQADAAGNPFRDWIGRRWMGAGFLGQGRNAVYAGQSSAMLDGRGTCKIGFSTPPIRVTPPTRLRLVAYVAAEALSQGSAGPPATIAATDLSENQVLPGATAALPAGSYGWKKIEMVFDVPSICPSLKLFIQLYRPGRLWVDEMGLTGADLDATLGVTVTDTGRPLKADPPIVSETQELLAKKAKALAALGELRKAVEQAKAKHVETLYDEIPLLLGDVAFKDRWDLPEHLKLRDGYADFLLQRATAAAKHLADVMAGRSSNLAVPPHPDRAKLTLKGRYFCEGDTPRLLLALFPGRWFGSVDHAFIPAVGATRYDFQKSPVWEVYQKDPDTHRVYDDSWCGHIIRDQNSDGGTDRCVISLDSPKMREAIAASIANYCAKVKASGRTPLFVNMGYEYSYVNYDKFSGEAFRAWLERKYRTIEALNKIWKTNHKSFAEVAMPSYDWTKPEANPARYYDWGEFNLWRFTDFLKWAKAEIGKALPGVPTTTGGGYPFGSGFWSQGIDEEELVDQGVNDLFLSETGSRSMGVTGFMDLQHSLAPDRLILDPEYHANPNTCFLMFLHGCGVMDYWWWPNDITDFYESSLRHSHLYSLAEVEAVVKTALDIRRLGRYIVPFPAAPASLALLYSKESLIQKDPLAKGNKTPYEFESDKSYAAAVRLDTPVAFASSKRVVAGDLSKYKILVVPGCRYVSEPVFEKIKGFAEAGGTVVITPISLVADEYSRKRSYLADLGIEVTAEELPEYMAAKAVRGVDMEPGEFDFIQGPIARTIVSKEPQRRLTLRKADIFTDVARDMKAPGVIQTVKASDAWQVLAAFQGAAAQPAILVRNLGRGKVYYLAGQLAVEDRQVLFDRLMDACGVDRPIRAWGAQGGYPAGMESRTVAFDGAFLTYLHNETAKAVEVKLVPSRGAISEIANLSAEEKTASPTLSLAPYETRLLRIAVK